jgi:hypothetical protein
MWGVLIMDDQFLDLLSQLDSLDADIDSTIADIDATIADLQVLLEF